jgi:hypothetical protein
VRLKNFIIVVAIGMTGCATEQLQFTATRQMSTEPDIYIEQVMSNLARIAADPTVLPYFNTLDSGVPQDTDRLTIGGFLQFPAQTIVKQLHNQRGGQLGPLTGERDINVPWTIKPVNDEGRLRAMQGLYLWVLDRLDPEDLCDVEKKVGTFYLGQNGKSTFSFGQIEHGWFRSGSWWDKPKEARYYIHHHGTYCWVEPGYEKALTDLTLRMLRIALNAKRTKTVVRMYYNVEGRVAQTESSVEAVAPIVPGGSVRRPEIYQRRYDAYREILWVNRPYVLYILNKNAKLLHKVFTECEMKESGGTVSETLLKNKLKDPIAVATLVKDPEIREKIRAITQTPDDNANAERESVLDSSLDPELNIDTFSNPELSPGLITGTPH